MTIYQGIKTTFHALLCLWLILSPLQANMAQAALISTETRMAQLQGELALEPLNEMLSSEDLHKALQQFGVAPETLAERVSQMTLAERAELQAELDQMPAGAGIVGTVVLVFVVLIVLDLLGTTNIFPVIKPINQQ